MRNDSTNTTHNSQYLQVPRAQEGQRIDNFLFVKLKKIPKSHIYKIIRSGQIRVNMRRVANHYRLQEDDMIRLPPQIHYAPKTPKLKNKKPIGDIIFEDDDILVINKLPGIAVHGGSGVNHGVIEYMRESLSNPRLELVHRLDRDTSGCLLLAKKRSVLKYLHQLFAEKHVDKSYAALVWHPWTQKESSVINAPLKRFVLSGGQRVVKVSSEGKEAKTIATPQKLFPEHALVRLKPLHGRTHQLRVHMAHIQHPIVGDNRYGNKSLDKVFQQKYNAKRMFLHAEHLKFSLAGKNIAVSAPLDKDFNRICVELSHEIAEVV